MSNSEHDKREIGASMQPERSVAGHLTDEQLVLISDGELSNVEKKSALEHLEVCWACRARAERTEQAIADFMEFREEVLRPSAPRSAEMRHLLVSELRGRSSQAAPQSWFSQLFASAKQCVGSMPYSIPARMLTGMGVAAAVVILAYVFLPRPGSPRSGEALLSASARAERSALTNARIQHLTIVLEERDGATGQFLVSHRIEQWRGSDALASRVFDHNDRIVAGEWRKPDGSRVILQNARLRMDPPSVDPLQDSIWRLTPSADNFVRVTGHPARIRVEERPSVYILHYENENASGSPALVNATLTLRRPDLHPVRQTLRIEQEGLLRDYSFIESGFEQRPASERLAKVFEPDVELATSPRSETIPLEPLSGIAPVDLGLDVLERLDRANALVQEQLRFQHDAHGIAVRGIVDTPERKAQLKASLGSLLNNPALRFEVTTAEEAMRPQGETQQIRVESFDIAPHATASQETLRHFLAGRGYTGDQLTEQLQKYTNEVFTHSGQAQLHALVLKQLVSEFTSAEIAELKPEARAQWRKLVNRHTEAISLELTALEQQLQPAFGKAPGALVSSDGRTRDLHQAAIELCVDVATLDRAIGKSLALSANGSSDVTVETPHFWTLLSRARAVALSLTDKTND